eukprot:NODE_2700_length_1059_cov_5.052475_g2250_i0.p5 GENE.NODE_2700_length_1059_cov_5.052475_g2250_i0~~NODE_2700_length_1059_cov_5.052475_g2250_i0.p5  ORF type:complete len:52 (+),score=12.48 NODE_2700_length_1059_cov_5.052475_g2250_i0:83-238(+)
MRMSKPGRTHLQSSIDFEDTVSLLHLSEAIRGLRDSQWADLLKKPPRISAL